MTGKDILKRITSVCIEQDSVSVGSIVRIDIGIAPAYLTLIKEIKPFGGVLGICGTYARRIGSFPFSYEYAYSLLLGIMDLGLKFFSIRTCTEMNGLDDI